MAGMPEVREALRGPASPLDPETKADMEDRLGTDLGSVRVHDDAAADESAQSIGAVAYTVGDHIAFRRDRYAPATLDGRRLLVHELTHVVQQRGMSDGPVLQRQRAKGKEATRARFWFTVRISSMLDSDQLLTAFIRQYRRLPPDADVAELRKSEGWKWTGDPPVVTARHVSQGFIRISVVDPRIEASTPQERKRREQDFRRLPPEERSDLTAETDRQFRETTRQRPGERIGTSKQDRDLAEYWRRLRDEFVRRRQALDALPPALREVLFLDSGQPLAPRDYEAALRIAGKLEALSPAELSEYRARTTKTAASWTEFETSIDRYLAEHGERRKSAERRQDLTKRLFGLDDLYRRWRTLQTLRTAATLAGLGDEGALAAIARERHIAETKAELDADLTKANFAGVAGFEATMREFQDAFEWETLVVARIMLDRYEHVLVGQEQRYQNSAEAIALHQRVGQTSARRHYEEADKYYAMRKTPYSLEEQAQQSEAIRRYREERALADQAVRSLAPDDPLLDRPDFDREKLARAGLAEVQPQLQGYIAARRRDIAKSRQDLEAKPKLSWQLDVLLNASRAAQNISRDSIYDKILHDRARDVAVDEAIPHLLLAVFALAAGLLTGGTGAVPVLAAGTVLGIGAYQAIEEFRRYETKSSAYGAGLLSAEPSMAWVIVAVVAAGIDLAVFTATTLRTIRPVLEAFNQTSDLVKLSEGLAGVETGLRESILKAARAESEARAAWQAVFRPAVSLRAVLVPGAEEFGKLVYAVYLSAVRGIRDFQVFVRTREAEALIGKAAQLASEDLALLKAAHGPALLEADELTRFGRSIGMADEQVRPFVGLRSSTRMTADEIKAEMRAFRAGGTAGRTAAAAREGLEPAELAARVIGRADAEATKVRDVVKAIQRDIDGVDAQLGPLNERIAEAGRTGSPYRSELPSLTAGRRELVAEKKNLLDERRLRNQEIRTWEGAGWRRAYERYQELRRRTPGGAGDDVVATAGGRDTGTDALGRVATPADPLTADHVVPVVEIAFMENFLLLGDAAALRVLNHRPNLVALVKSANSARRETPWSSWQGWSLFTADASKRQVLIELELRMREELHQLIQTEYARQLARGGR